MRRAERSGNGGEKKLSKATLEAVKLTEYMLLRTAKLLPLPGYRWDR